MLRIAWEMEQGRNGSWLARELGVSRSHVARLLNEEREWTQENREKAARALHWQGDVAGLFVQVEPCAACQGYGTQKVEEDGHRYVALCSACNGDGCVEAGA